MENKKEMQEQKLSFQFTYSAQEQEELQKIRQKYQPQEESKMEKLRRLDASVTKKAARVSITCGVIGALLLGMGMSIIMSEFGAWLGLTGVAGMAVGIVIGMNGMLLIGLAYPAYHYSLKKEREKIAPEMIRLTEELMQ